MGGHSPGRLRNFPQQLPSANLALLVCYWVVQAVRANVAPVSVEAVPEKKDIISDGFKISYSFQITHFFPVALEPSISKMPEVTDSPVSVVTTFA